MPPFHKVLPRHSPKMARGMRHVQALSLAKSLLLWSISNQVAMYSIPCMMYVLVCRERQRKPEDGQHETRHTGGAWIEPTLAVRHTERRAISWSVVHPTK